MNNPLVPLSWGELIDKITILDIKARRLQDEAALRNVQTELQALRAIAFPPEADERLLAELTQELARVNEQLWDIEDAIRLREAKADFGPAFVELARAVYKTNDERSRIKRRINVALSSALVEEKSYQPY